MTPAKPSHPLREPAPTWNECTTLMQWAEQMLRQGHTVIVRNMIRTLPEQAREKYRELYVRIQQEKKKEGGA